ncbi:MAG TPA: RES domain-containing protein, partial [Acidimicrobiales bacterium]|nr:RES domain-containing protein [Acidimicrobiales bacterium]
TPEVLLYRVFPHLAAARTGRPGHALHIHPRQGSGRWDNPHLYKVVYLATSPEAAIGETFADRSVWSPAMLRVPQIPGASRALGVYRLREESHPFLDLDDANALAARSIRPSFVVARNRPRTQAIAASVHAEAKWSGIQWWSFHRPQWTVAALWATADLVFDHMERLPGHVALEEAAATLGRPVLDL